MLRRVLLVLAILCAVVVVALGVLIATFDADRYRPLLVRELEKALHKPVKLERISLGWQGGIALQLRGFAVFDDPGTAGEPLLDVRQASGLVRLRPLLHREVDVSSLVLSQPTVRLTRDAQGRVNLLGLAVAAAPARASSGPHRTAGEPVSFSIASFQIHDGTVHWSDALTSPQTELWLKHVELQVKAFSLTNPIDVEMSGAVAGEAPNLRLRARVRLPNQTSAGAIDHAQFSLDRIAIERLTPSVAQDAPQLRGLVALSLQGGVTTLDPVQWARAASGSGTLSVEEPTLANLNILRVVFTQLSLIPSLGQKLQERLPQDYQAKFAAEDTIFEPIQLDAALKDGALRFQDLRLKTDVFQLAGTGGVALNGVVGIHAMLAIEPTLSAAIVRSVNELGGLLNADGAMEIPVLISGQAPRVSVTPDLKYVASKVLVNAAVDALGRLLKKENGEQAPAPAESGGGDLLGTLLQRALQPKKSSQPVQ